MAHFKEKKKKLLVELALQNMKNFKHAIKKSTKKKSNHSIT
jgi:hypothetical protein